MYVCMYVCMYVRTYVRMYVRMYVCMHVCMYVCMHACMYVCSIYVVCSMYVCMHVCMYVCMYVCLLYVVVSEPHAHIPTHARTCTQTLTQTDRRHKCAWMTLRRARGHMAQAARNAHTGRRRTEPRRPGTPYVIPMPTPLGTLLNVALGTLLNAAQCPA